MLTTDTRLRPRLSLRNFAAARPWGGPQVNAAENVIAATRDVGMDPIGGDEGYARFLENGGGGTTRRRVAAGYGKLHAVLADELVRREHRLFGLGLVVLGDQLALLAQHPP